MKPLELTPEHRTKLLEMCNLLFKNCKWHFWESDSDDYPTYSMIGYSNHVNLGTNKKIIPSLEIHWFEFCMTHLVDKLNNIKFNNNDSSFIFWKDLAISNGHMVDYLYNEFKKLNK